VVVESAAQYWMPVWRALEGQCELHLAHAQSNRAPQGRKRDFADGKTGPASAAPRSPLTPAA